MKIKLSCVKGVVSLYFTFTNLVHVAGEFNNSKITSDKEIAIISF